MAYLLTSEIIIPIQLPVVKARLSSAFSGSSGYSHHIIKTPIQGAKNAKIKKIVP
ncbi:MAG: hypothetical protein SOU12_05970 [Lentihominibacter sp.]|nr:hypothetical protein [Lentihominibacter sp.]